MCTIMRKIIKQITVLSLILACGTSCNLDRYPYDSISTETAWTGVSDATKFEAGLYSSIRGMFSSDVNYGSEIQTDLFNATVSFGNNGGDLYTWNFNSSQGTLSDYWSSNYVCINNSNGIINNIGKIVTTDSKELALLSKVKGEAFLARAMAYHNLVLRYAKDYNKASAQTDLGLPIVLKENDVENKPARATLEDTYKQIKSDIVEAKKLLVVPGAANSTVLTADVIEAFDARVNFYMDDFTAAIANVNAIIAKYPLVNSADSWTSMWLNDSSSELLFMPFQSVDERSYSVAPYTSYRTTTSSYSPDFVPTKWMLELYEAGDIRKSSFLLSKITCNDIVVNNVYMLNKYPGNPKLKKTEYEYYNAPKPFRSSELYLIAAESYYKNGDAVNALKFLNDLRTARQASVLTGLTGDALFTAIKNEWIREFAGEGKRLDNLKRWNDGFTRNNPQNIDLLMDGPIYTGLTIQAGNKKFVWEIPDRDLSSNLLLKPNW